VLDVREAITRAHPQPGAWLTTTADRKAIDRMRARERTRRQAEGDCYPEIVDHT